MQPSRRGSLTRYLKYLCKGDGVHTCIEPALHPGPFKRVINYLLICTVIRKSETTVLGIFRHFLKVYHRLSIK